MLGRNNSLFGNKEMWPSLIGIQLQLGLPFYAPNLGTTSKLGLSSGKSNRPIKCGGYRRLRFTAGTWKKRQFRLPSILSSSDLLKISTSRLSSSSTVSDQWKSNYVEGYIENIKSHKRKSCRCMLPDLISLSRLMKSYSKIALEMVLVF